LEQGIVYSERLQQQTPSSSPISNANLGFSCRIILPWALCLRGYLDQAVHQTREIVRQSQAHANPITQAYVLSHAGNVHQCYRQVSAVREGAERLITLCREQQYGFFEAYGLIQQGWALVHQHQPEEGLRQLQQGISTLRTSGTGSVLSNVLVLLADAYQRLERVDEGLQILDEALSQAHQTGACCYEAEIHRLKGELLLQQSPDNYIEAEICFQQAIDTAQHQSAKLWELRAATSLARLWQQQGKRKEAYDLLAPVYEWFTEGFDTVELQDARALLDELETRGP
jgi:predicted ATPase